MATGVTLEIGYISGSTSRLTESEAFETLKSCVHRAIAVSANRAHIHTAIDNLECSEDERILFLIEVQDSYNHKSFSPLQIDEDEKRILIMASGGSDWRIAKEIIMQTIVANVVRKMLYAGIPVNVTFA